MIEFAVDQIALIRFFCQFKLLLRPICPQKYPAGAVGLSGAVAAALVFKGFGGDIATFVDPSSSASALAQFSKKLTVSQLIAVGY